MSARRSTFALAALALGLAGPAHSLAQTAGTAAAGAEVFEDRCSMCHNPKGGGQGPSLEGVVGRRAGSLPGFGYTPAMKSAGARLAWTAPNLDRFLSGPGKLVPGTAMKVVLADAQQRRDLIAYLASRRGRP